MSILPWRMTYRGGLINTMLKVPLRRLALSRLAARLLASGLDDVTVVIGTRNQANFRLRHALRSIRDQDYAESLIQITIVDYGSDVEVCEAIRSLCAEFNAKQICVSKCTCWNRSRALNIGIRAATTKFVLTSDVDIIFQQTYVSEVIRELRRNPLSVVYSQTWDSTHDMIELFLGDSEEFDFCTLRRNCTARPAGRGINATFTRFYHLIRGYDEFYELYGEEDIDLHRRFNWLGLTARSIADRASFIHQWHPTNPGNARAEGHQVGERNRRYFNSARGIIRNTKEWGSAW